MIYTPAQRMAFESLNIPYVCLEPNELEIYDAALRELRPRLCLEWGAGWSTIYFPSCHPYIKKWIAIEHDLAWYHRLRGRVPASVDLWHCPDKDDYVFRPFALGVKFDFICVDGVHRGMCMLAASILLEKGGRVFLHDTGRQRYAKWFGAFDHAEKLAEGINPHPDGGWKGRGLHVFWNDGSGSVSG